MMSDWVCSQCGCRHNHYSSNRMCLICDGCGNSVRDPQLEQDRQQYDRTLQHARNHCVAGNWTKTISLLQPLMEQHPEDPRLYRLTLKAATKNYTDYEVTDKLMHDAAQNAWDKIKRISTLDQEMIYYNRTKYTNKINALLKKRDIVLIWVFLLSVILLLFAIFIACNFWAGIFISILAIGGCVSRLIILKAISIIISLLKPAPDFGDNPFVEE